METRKSFKVVIALALAALTMLGCVPCLAASKPAKPKNVHFVYTKNNNNLSCGYIAWQAGGKCDKFEYKWVTSSRCIFNGSVKYKKTTKMYYSREFHSAKKSKAYLIKMKVRAIKGKQKSAWVTKTIAVRRS